MKSPSTESDDLHSPTAKTSSGGAGSTVDSLDADRPTEVQTMSPKMHRDSRLSLAVGALSLLVLGTEAAAAESYVSVVLPQGSLANDAVEIGPDGLIYCTYCLFSNQTRQILRTTPEGESEVFSTLEGESCTLGMTFDPDGNLYAANLALDRIERFAPDGTRSAYSEDPLLAGPADLEFHPSGNGDLYVANHGSGAVVVLHPDGPAETFYGGPEVTSPHALTFDEAGNLYIGNLDASVTKIAPDGTASFFTQLPGVGYLEYSAGRIYAAVVTGHEFYEISLADGSYTRIAGTGTPGFGEGPGDETPIHSPNGISASADGLTIYTSSGFGNGLFRIDIADPAAVEDPDSPPSPGTHGMQLLPPRPNPSSGPVELQFRTDRNAKVDLAVFDTGGRHIRSLSSRPFPAGSHSVRWDGLDGTGVPLPSGLYLVRLQVGNETQTRRVVLGR